MKTKLTILLCSFVFSVFFMPATAQQTVISGSIRNSLTNEIVPAASVIVKGTTIGTFSDEKGNFRINANLNFPITLVFTSVGFEPQELTVNSADPVQVSFVPASSLGEAVVISASRIAERILESPVSIERISTANIRNMPATSYYDMLRQIKGVDMTVSSLTFATPTTRGFSGSGNARLNQLVDGMDNQAPGLNFSVGSVIGVTELDVESMELLPGASSALYGPGGMNGTLLINSKNPFKYQGFSFQVREGVMHVDKKQRDKPSGYHDWSLRWGKKVSDRFAFKIGAQFIHAKDWIGTDRTNYQAGDQALNQYGSVKPGDRVSDPNYDGVNVYGDETTLNLRDASLPVLGLVSAGIKAQMQTQLPPDLMAAASGYLDSVVGSYGRFDVSRTGYEEKETVENNTVNLKLSGGLYYKLTEHIEASLVGYWGTGNTVYTGSDRYSLKNMKIGQYKLELKHDNWFVRAYTTQENAGDSYNATIATRLFNEAWKPSATWYQQYAQAFLLSKVTPYVEALASQSAFTPTPDGLSHSGARNFADQGRPAAGSEQFNTLFKQVSATPISKGGGLFLDRSDLYLVEGQYNFGNLLKFADLLAGASWKQYVLNSQGTLFADTAGVIKINEIGAYAQLSRALLDGKIKLTAAGRFDYNQNFTGRFTPRFTAVYKLAEDQYIRGSYQTAYRFPTTQNQWINLVIGGGTVLLGGLPELRDFYRFKENPVYSVASVRAAGAAIQSGTPVNDAIALLQEQRFGEYKPETLKSFEIGYKGLFGKKLLIDAYAYFGKYNNFLGRTIVLQALQPGNPAMLFNSSSRRSISVAVNSAGSVSMHGYGISADWLLPNNFMITASATSDRIGDVAPGFVSFFNAPSYRLIAGLGNTGFGYEKRFGFNVNLRNQDGFYYESDFRQGDIPGYTTVDAQVNYKFPKQRSVVKLGGTNIFNSYYKTAFGNPEIGGIYYVSFGYNVF
ncbi:MAG: TonB-dependent receptor [Chitinophagaceae bacterium]|nr:TonB-dependent receptor [Chitinophagaceae bacterium]